MIVHSVGVGVGTDVTPSLCAVYGSALLSHSLHGGGFSENAKIGSGFDPENGMLCITHTLSFTSMTTSFSYPP